MRTARGMKPACANWSTRIEPRTARKTTAVLAGSMRAGTIVFSGASRVSAVARLPLAGLEGTMVMSGEGSKRGYQGSASGASPLEEALERQGVDHVLRADP